MTKAILTQDELKEKLYYNKDTGIFTYKVKNTRNNIGDIAGKNTYRYASIMINKKSYLCHRLAWLYVYGEFPLNFIDHINGNKLDNRIGNLRECTNAENQMNRGANSRNSSGFKNVFFRGYCNSYQVVISVNGVRKCLGYFKSAESANEARENAEKIEHGKFYFNQCRETLDADSLVLEREE